MYLVLVYYDSISMYIHHIYIFEYQIHLKLNHEYMIATKKNFHKSYHVVEQLWQLFMLWKYLKYMQLQ